MRCANNCREAAASEHPASWTALPGHQKAASQCRNQYRPRRGSVRSIPVRPPSTSRPRPRRRRRRRRPVEFIARRTRYADPLSSPPPTGKQRKNGRSMPDRWSANGDGDRWARSAINSVSKPRHTPRIYQLSQYAARRSANVTSLQETTTQPSLPAWRLLHAPAATQRVLTTKQALATTAFTPTSYDTTDEIVYQQSNYRIHIRKSINYW